MSLETLNDIFFAVAERKADRVMLHNRAGEWLPISAQEFYRNVAGVARALQGWGISKGDRVAILSENRPEWPIADFAALSLGAVVVPIYTTLTHEQIVYILQDSGARVAFVSSEAHLRNVLSLQSQTNVGRIVVMDRVESAHSFPMERLMHSGSASDAEFEAQARTIRPDDLATIIYTSGTTGTSKGVMLTHGNMASNIVGWLQGFDFHPGHTSLSFLPLSHVTARSVDFGLLYRGAVLAYCPFLENLPQALAEVRPSLFIAVPRVYEKVHTQVNRTVNGFPKHAIYRWALAVGREHKPEILAGETPRSWRWRLANKLVFSPIRAGLGGQVEIFISGGAPLGRDLADWYATVGIRIHEGYGLTETSPVIAVNTPANHRLGTVGKVLSNIEVRIAEDGEILVRGPSVFKAYWNRPQETQNAFVDGWFKTGDIGAIDSDGFLSVTDRKKDLLKTSGGKFIAPQPIENSLKLNALVGAAVVVGDKRKFPAVIISPHFPLLEDWARANNIESASRGELVAHPKVQALYEAIVETCNQNLARFEKLKKVMLVAEEFSSADGSLTPTLKLRRRVVEERYRQRIEELYAEAEVSAVL